MQSLFRKSVGAFRQYQFGVFNILLNRLLPESFSFRNYIIYSYDLKAGPPEPPPPNPQVTIHKVEDPEDDLFKKFRTKFPARAFATRIKKDKEHAYIATKNDEVVGYAWVTEDEHYLSTINHHFTLSDDEVFLYSCFVTQDHRGEGIHTLLLYERLRDFTSRDNYKTAYTGVISVNKGSIKGVKKAGFKEERRVKYVKFLGLEKRWWG